MAFDIKITSDLTDEELDSEIDRFRAMGYARDLQKNKPKKKKVKMTQEQEDFIAEMVEKHGRK